MMKVLISGAGVAGPTLAWFLGRNGVNVTLVEKAPKLLAHGQNVDIRGTALKVVEKMGLVEEVHNAFTNEVGTRFIYDSGKPFASFPMIKGMDRSPTSEFEIMRGDLAAILCRASEREENVKFLWGTVIQEVLTNDDSGVKVRLSNGTEGTYDLLVAADGQWSPVRRKCFPPESVTVIDKNAYFAYWTMPRLETDDNWWTVFIGLQSRLVSMRPDPHGTMRGLLGTMPLSQKEGEEWRKASRSDREMQQKLLHEKFTGAGWQADRLLATVDDAEDFYFQALQQIRMDHWSVGRVVCLGDAAHAPSPLTGMGTSLAILGAYFLAGEISKLKPGQHPRPALEAYQAAFKPHVDKVQEIPSFVPSIAYPKGSVHRWLLRILLSVVAWVVNSSFFNRFAGSSQEDALKLPDFPGLITAVKPPKGDP